MACRSHSLNYEGPPRNHPLRQHRNTHRRPVIVANYQRLIIAGFENLVVRAYFPHPEDRPKSALWVYSHSHRPARSEPVPGRSRTAIQESSDSVRHERLEASSSHGHLPHAIDLRQLLRHDRGGRVKYIWPLVSTAIKVSASMKSASLPGFTFRYEGLLKIRGSAAAALMAACTSRAAASMSWSSENCNVTLVDPRELDGEVISVTSAICPNCCSSGVATDEAMVFRTRPANWR